MATCGHDFGSKIPQWILDRDCTLFVCDECIEKIKKINDKKVKIFEERMQKKYEEKIQAQQEREKS